MQDTNRVSAAFIQLANEREGHLTGPKNDSAAMIDPDGILTAAEIKTRQGTLERLGYGSAFSELLTQKVGPALREQLREGDTPDMLDKMLEDSKTLSVLGDWLTSGAAKGYGPIIPDSLIRQLEQIADQVETPAMTNWRLAVSAAFPAYVSDATDFNGIVFNLGQNASMLSTADKAVLASITHHLLGIEYPDLVEIAMATHAERLRLLEGAGIPVAHGRVDFTGVAAGRLATAGDSFLQRVVGRVRVTRQASSSLDVLRGEFSDRQIRIVMEVIDELRASSGSRKS